ncbi:hypothetical protein U9M48_040387, partial [Paspalum notatum var. saurae]
MAPPAGTVAAAEMGEAGVLEVRCVGCGDTLEVERGLTEFACPGCATPQALPLELMPPPPRPRRALPLGPATAPVRVPCAGCGAVLAVPPPRGIRHLLACPLCGEEIDVDGAGRLASRSGVQVISPPGTVVLPAMGSRMPVEGTINRATHVGQVQVGSYSIHREESPVRLVNETAEGSDFRKKHRPSDGPGSVTVDKVRLEHPSKASHALSVDTEEAHGENQSGTIRRTGIQKARYAVPSISEQERVEPPTQIACAQQVEVESCDNITVWNQKIKRSSKTSAGNQEGQKRVLSSSSEEIHHSCSKHVGAQGIRKRNPIQQTASSPNENQFDPSDIDRIINRLCHSALPHKRVSQASSNDSDSVDATLPPVSTNHGISQGDCLPHGYRQYQAVATSSLAKQGFHSVQEHGMPQECLNAIVPRNSNQARQDLPVDILHRQQIQEYPSHGSQSEKTQVESHHNKSTGHYKKTAKSPSYLTEEDNLGEQHHSGTNLRVTASSNTTTLPSLLTATPLPVTTPPPVVSRTPVQRLQRHYQSSEASHSQGTQSVGIGSINRSSKKSRGRGPTKLIEPRREAARPVLIPNNTDTWDVDPLCPRVSSTISALLKQWHPGSTYALANQLTNEVHQEELILHWHQYHSDTRAIIVDEFLQRYKWAPGQEAVCLKLFDRKIARQLTAILCDEKRRARVELASSRKVKEALDAASSKQTNLDDEDAGGDLKQQGRDPASVGREDDDPLLWKPLPPEWMQPKWWGLLCEHWASEEALQVSAQKRRNRYTGGCSAQHTGGSRSIAMHRKLMIIENGGKPVSDIEVFNRTHKRDGGKGDFVSEKAKETVERFKRHLEEAGDTAQEAGGRRRGRYRLHGIIDKARISAMAKSIPGFVDKRTKKEMFTQDQVQEMISQATQQLNEAWEKRFQSLEQKMHGMVSSEAPQHDPRPSAAEPVAEDQQASQQKKRRHGGGTGAGSPKQDASDSSHEGSYQSTTDDDDEDEDYLMIYGMYQVIKCAFPEGHQGSKVMKPLYGHNSRLLFYGRVFGLGNTFPQPFEPSDKILQKCGGLPLAIISVGLLASQLKRSVGQWNYVLNSLRSDLRSNKKNPTLEGMRQILNLSYTHHLKTCLLYIGMYPEDREIEKDHLVMQWIAEDARDALKIAKSYLNELVNRSMIIQLVEYYTWNMERVRYKMHAMVLDLILSTSAEENFLGVVDNQQAIATSKQYKTRRLSLQLDASKHDEGAPHMSLPHITMMGGTLYACQQALSLIWSNSIYTVPFRANLCGLVSSAPSGVDISVDELSKDDIM